MARETYVHIATIEPAPGSNLDAIGAAVTAELCGHWEHEPPCRWPHNNALVAAEPGRVALRTVFVARPDEELNVRSRIDRALHRGALTSDRGSAVWRTLGSDTRAPDAEESALGARLGG